MVVRQKAAKMILVLRSANLGVMRKCHSVQLGYFKYESAFMMTLLILSTLSCSGQRKMSIQNRRGVYPVRSKDSNGVYINH